MTFPLLCFYAFAAVSVLAALGVISVKNPVYAVLFMVLTFFSTACVWLLAEAEFLALALIVVYVGAVMVLFLFVVMMLDIRIDSLREGFARYLPVGIIVAAVMLAEMLALIGVRSMHAADFGVEAARAQGMSNTEWLGMSLFQHFLLPFEIAAVILTVGLIAAVTLTLRQRSGARKQYPSAQVAVKAADRVRVVKMQASKPQTSEPQGDDA